MGGGNKQNKQRNARTHASELFMMKRLSSLSKSLRGSRSRGQSRSRSQSGRRLGSSRSEDLAAETEIGGDHAYHRHQEESESVVDIVTRVDTGTGTGTAAATASAGSERNVHGGHHVLVSNSNSNSNSNTNNRNRNRSRSQSRPRSQTRTRRSDTRSSSRSRSRSRSRSSPRRSSTKNSSSSKSRNIINHHNNELKILREQEQMEVAGEEEGENNSSSNKKTKLWSNSQRERNKKAKDAGRAVGTFLRTRIKINRRRLSTSRSNNNKASSSSLVSLSLEEHDEGGGSYAGVEAGGGEAASDCDSGSGSGSDGDSGDGGLFAVKTKQNTKGGTNSNDKSKSKFNKSKSKSIQSPIVLLHQHIPVRRRHQSLPPPMKFITTTTTTTTTTTYTAPTSNTANANDSAGIETTTTNTDDTTTTTTTPKSPSRETPTVTSFYSTTGKRPAVEETTFTTEGDDDENDVDDCGRVVIGDDEQDQRRRHNEKNSSLLSYSDSFGSVGTSSSSKSVSRHSSSYYDGIFVERRRRRTWNNDNSFIDTMGSSYETTTTMDDDDGASSMFVSSKNNTSQQQLSSAGAGMVVDHSSFSSSHQRTNTTTATSNYHHDKSYSKHREDLLLESQRAIQRKQNHATNSNNRQVDHKEQQTDDDDDQKKQSPREQIPHVQNDKEQPEIVYDWSFLDENDDEDGTVLVSPPSLPPQTEKSATTRQTTTSPGGINSNISRTDKTTILSSRSKDLKTIQRHETIIGRSRSLSLGTPKDDRKLGRHKNVVDNNDDNDDILFESDVDGGGGGGAGYVRRIDSRRVASSKKEQTHGMRKRSKSVDARPTTTTTATTRKDGRWVGVNHQSPRRQRSGSLSSPTAFHGSTESPHGGCNPPTLADNSTYGGPPRTFGNDRFPSSAWHLAILKHDWDAVDMLLETFDHARYRRSHRQPPTSPDAAPSKKKNNKKKAKQKKKLRVLRYLPKRRSSSPAVVESSDDDDLDDDKADCQERTGSNDEPTTSPLLQVDEDGRTPLHVACTQQMPEKVLLKLYFVGREATKIQDCDGRYPIHLALIHDLSEQVIERFIHSNAASLGTPDRLHHSPLQYAIRKARRLQCREGFRTSDQMWSTPATPSQFEWQVTQAKAWGKVKFLLDEMIRRRKLLSPRSEKSVILQSVESRGPPQIIEAMLSTGQQLFDQEPLILVKTFSTILKYRYPTNIVQNMIKLAEKHLPPHLIAKILRNAVDELLQVGIRGVDESGPTSFCQQLLSAVRHNGVSDKVKVTSSCKEWWTTLRVLISNSARCQCNRTYDDNLLVAALAIPDPPTSLIIFLCRLMPPLRHTATGTEGMLPLHIYCSQKNMPQDSVAILKVLIGSDPTVAKDRCKVGRFPLHYAVLSDKSLAFVGTLLHSYRKAAFVVDPVSGFFPFQLAAMNGTMDALNVSFLLLHTKPHAIAPETRYGSGDSTSDITKLRRHVLNWCYKNDASRSTPILNRQRVDMLRDAIETGRIGDNSPLQRFWSALKSLIWTAYYETPSAVAMPLSDENLLLAALSVSDQLPPIVIELILELCPQSAFTEHPGTANLPIHAAANAPPYEPLPFEVVLSMDLTDMVVLSNPAALTLRSENGSLPLHIAIRSGKVWTVLHTLVERYPKALFVKDPQTHLFPFQLAACQEESFLLTSKLVQRKSVLTKWSRHSSKDNGRSLRRIVDEYRLNKLTTIYELLRCRPGVIDAVCH